ncbi:unnamed protein product [Urochloa humidicola]
MGAVSKAAVVVMVAQLLMAAMAAPAMWAKMDSSGAHGHGQEAAASKLGASRRLLQDVDCIAQDNTNVFCSKPCCDPTNVCATLADYLNPTNVCVDRNLCGWPISCP